MTTITDNFNRADGSIGSSSEGWSWGALASSTWVIQSNAAAKSASADSTQFVRAETDLSSDNNYAQAKLVAGARFFGGTACRMDTSAQSALNCYWFYHNGNVVISKFVAGGQTDLATLSDTYTQNSTYKIEANGSTITAYKDGSSLGNTSDSSVSTGKRAGMASYWYNGVTEANGPMFDDFVAADLAGGGSGPTVHMLPWPANLRGNFGVGAFE